MKVFFDVQADFDTYPPEVRSAAFVSDSGILTVTISEERLSDKEDTIQYIRDARSPVNLGVAGTREDICEVLKEWVLSYDSFHLVGDGMYNKWLVFVSLFGGKSNLPDNVNMVPLDVNREIARMLGLSEEQALSVNRESYTKRTDPLWKEDALRGALMVRACYRRIEEIEREWAELQAEMHKGVDFVFTIDGEVINEQQPG